MIRIPWKEIYDLDKKFDAMFPDGKGVPDDIRLAKMLGTTSDRVHAAFHAMDSGAFDDYLAARKLAIKRGFKPEDGLPDEVKQS